jgi:molybdenum cofactor guanylyltransferase
MIRDGIAGVVLAGGQGRRFGGLNKALLPMGSEFLFELVLRRLDEQLAIIGINANRNLAEIMVSGASIIPDGLGGDLGPLDGVLGALRFARASQCGLAVTVPVDTPFFPEDLASRLAAAAVDAPAYAVDCDGIAHKACAAWPLAMEAPLDAYLRAGGRKVGAFMDGMNAVPVSFAEGLPKSFMNINTPEDLAFAQRLLLEQDNGIPLY